MYEKKYKDTTVIAYPRSRKTKDGREFYGRWERKPIEFIEACDGSAKIRSLYDDFLEIYAKAEGNYTKFLLEAKSIIKGVVEDGQVPRGSCERCPKVISDSIS
jgi:hypothetical protein